MSFDSICKDIKSLKIQGAVAVAKKGSDALFLFSKSLKEKDPLKKYTKIKTAAKRLIATRETEPALRNAVFYMISNLNISSVAAMDKDIEKRHKEALLHFESAEKKIIEFGVRKISNGMTIFTHCHSSIVCKILIAAKKKGINFDVHNTETRPLFQGRKTALELSKAGIKVTHYVDSAARHALKKADMVLIGADAITTTKIYNKVGSEMFAILANSMDIPVYCCSDSWKFDTESVIGFDEEIERREKREIWPDAPAKIRIYNFAFDQISPRLVTAVISELGVYDHSIFVDEAQKNIKPFRLS